jgi:predicted enzyme related to lactoylglutathione lyase
MRVVHFELNVRNVEKTKEFYEKVFKWKIEKWEGPMEYWLIMTGDEKDPGIDGGLGKVDSESPSIVNTIDVKDVDKVIGEIEKQGGKIVNPKHAVPGVGWLAYFKDPEGLLFGIMQADPNAK